MVVLYIPAFNFICITVGYEVALVDIACVLVVGEFCLVVEARVMDKKNGFRCEERS